MLNISKLSFLYVDLVLKLIEKNLIQIKTLKFNNIPKSLNDVFQLIFNLNFSLINNTVNSTNKYLNEANIMILCLISYKSLTTDEIFQILSPGEHENCNKNEKNDYKSLLESLSTHFLSIQETTKLCKFSHTALRDWLFDKLKYSSKQYKKFNLKFGYYLYTLHLYKKLSILISSINNDSSAALDDNKITEFIIDYDKFLYYLLQSQFNSNSKVYLANLVLASIKSKKISEETVLTNFHLLLNMQSKLVFKFLLTKIFKIKTIDNISLTFSDNVNIPFIFVIACLDYKCLFQVVYKAFKQQLTLVNPDSGMNIISYACDYNSVELLKSVLKLVDSNSLLGLITDLDKKSFNPLFYAAKNGNINVIDCIFDNYLWPSRTIMTNVLGQVFVMASMYNQYDLVDYLIQKYSVSKDELNIDMVDSFKGETPLTMASTYGHINICKLLIAKANASLLQPNSKSLTPLLCAIKSNEWKVVEYLLNNYLSLDLLEKQIDKHNRTPLMIASSEGHLAIIDILIEKGVNLARQDCEGLSALGWACLKGHYNAVINLLNNGANINQTDYSGRTPLDLATFYGDCRLVCRLNFSLIIF